MGRISPTASAPHAVKPLVLDWDRLVSLPSQAYKYYILPRCDHEDDTTYPHNEIKEVNANVKCISEAQSKNVCMMYRMRLMLSGNEAWAQQKTNNAINAQYFEYEVGMRSLKILKRYAQKSVYQSSEEEVDPADEINVEEMTAQERGVIMEEIAAVEFFEPWQTYRFLKQFLSQAENGEEMELEESEYIDPDIRRFSRSLELFTRIPGAMEAALQESDIQDACDSGVGIDMRHVDVEEFPLQPMANIESYAVDGDHTVFRDKDNGLWVQLNFSEKGLAKLAAEGVSHVVA